MAAGSNSATASSGGRATRDGEVNLVFRETSQAAGPKTSSQKNTSFPPHYFVIWFMVIVVGLALISFGLERADPSTKTVKEFKCSFINETTPAEKDATEVCDYSENSIPYCFAVFHQNLKTYNHKATSAGCWAKDSDENDQCIKAAKGSDSGSACVIQKISGIHQAIFCCCSHNMCSESFKSLPSIYIKYN